MKKIPITFESIVPLDLVIFYSHDFPRGIRSMMNS